jgi:cytoskeletal protein RodZ
MLKKLKKMRAIKSTSNKKKNQLIAAIVVAVALLTGGIVYALSSDIFKTIPETKGPTQEQLDEQKNTEEDSKQEFIDSTKDNELPGTNPSTPTSSDSITLTTAMDQGTVTVNTKLMGFNSGTCELSITNGSQKVVKNADIIYQPEFSTCAGFSILKSELSTGSWNISLKVVEGGTVFSKSVTVLVE